MTDNSLSRLQRIAADILPDQTVEIRPRGEDYYVFEIGGSVLAPIWIDTSASDHQISDKLSHDFERAFHPESSPDDLSVPDLQSETKQPKQSS
jgi:hypothetical protein